MKKSNTVVQYYWNQAMRYKKYTFGVLFSVPLTVLINSYLPSLIVANILSRVSQRHYSHRIFHDFGLQLIAYFILLIIGIATWRLVDWFAWRLEASVEQDMAEEVFAHLMSETADFHANSFSGSLVSQSNKLLSSYIRMADTTVFQVLPLLFGLVFTAVILAPRALIFTVLLLIFSALFMTSALITTRNVRRLGNIHASNESQQTGYLADAITNVMAIKSFARSDYEKKRFHSATSQTRSSLFNLARAQNKLFNRMGFISRTMSAIALLMGVIGVVVLHINIGTVFLMISYTSSIVDQLFNFSNSSLRNYNRAIGDANDMVSILSETPAVLDPAQPEKSRLKSGQIELNDVTFVHSGAEDAIFNNFNLSIRPGEKIGLVGHSGSGKSTLVRLLLRFSDIDSGEILIDGQDIASIKQDDLHRSIAYVPQEPLLFHRTIAENISYGKPKAKATDIERASKQAHAYEFIKTLPDKFETLVGERGVKLSGGQRQRVAIARALLKDAPILILDEATSSLDSESEVLIQDALWRLMKGRTAIVIAHRLSTIQKMDRIIVLDNGQIAEQGSHKDLLAKDGVYAKLWSHQSGGFIEDDE